MDFGLAFTYPFQDPDWAKKIGIAALISLIPLIGVIFLLGWSLEVTRRVVRRDPTPLPDIDFGRQFGDGLKGLVIGIVYGLPIFLFVIPIWIISGLAAGGDLDMDTYNVLVALVSVCCGGLVLIYSLLLAFITPAAYANFIVKDQLGAAFRFNEVIGLVRAAPGAYLLVLLGVILASSFIAPLGGIACGIGALFTTAYALAVNGHLYGQAYLEASRNQGYAY